MRVSLFGDAMNLTNSAYETLGSQLGPAIRCADLIRVSTPAASRHQAVVIAAKGRHHETMSNDWRDDVARARETIVAAVSEADTSAAASARLLR